MTQLLVNGRSYSTKLIAFDKDGTLVEFHHLWGRKTWHWVEAMVTSTGGDDNLRTALFGTLGFSTEKNRVVADGPIAVASNPKLYTVAAAVLYQHGLGWHQAETVAQQSGTTIFGALPTAELIQPIGDVARTIKRLSSKNIRIAIVTSDDRIATEATLHLLGIADYVDVIVCGDDALLPNKPDPAVLRYLGQQFGVHPAQILMVGDTESDMLFGRKAGVGGCIGVTGGAGDEKLLGEAADTLISSIAAIQVDDNRH